VEERPQVRHRDPDDVHEILIDLATEGEMARLDARLEELTQDVDRLVAEVERADSTRRGELDVMRARIEDGLTHIRETTDEQREVWRRFDERLMRIVIEHRNDLARLAQTVLEEVAETRDGGAAVVEELELRIQGDVEAVRAELNEGLDRASKRVEELRRELDSRLVEMRAEQRVVIARLEESLGELSEGVLERIEVLEQQSAADRDRWLEALSATGMTIRETAQSLRRTMDRERGARTDSDRVLAERLGEAESRMERPANRASNATSRHDADVSRLENRLRELDDRISVLERHAHDDAQRVGTDDMTEVISELVARVERAESIAREAGRVVVNAVRRGRRVRWR
jgi:hypothetical protein